MVHADVTHQQGVAESGENHFQVGVGRGDRPLTGAFPSRMALATPCDGPASAFRRPSECRKALSGRVSVRQLQARSAFREPRGETSKGPMAVISLSV